MRSVADGLLRFGVDNDLGDDDDDATEAWAGAVEALEVIPSLDPYVGSVKGIGVALFCYLRMRSVRTRSSRTSGCGRRWNDSVHGASGSGRSPGGFHRPGDRARHQPPGARPAPLVDALVGPVRRSVRPDRTSPASICAIEVTVVGVVMAFGDQVGVHRRRTAVAEDPLGGAP